MLNRDEIQLMVQAARLYYNNNLTQEEIAGRLKVTRQKVSRLLIEARTQGIVDITIHDPNPTDPHLADELKERFGLNRVILAASEGLDSDRLRSGLGMAAAAYLEETLQDGQRVGIGWGRSVYAAMSSLRSTRQKHVHVTPVIGGIGDLSPFFQVNELARRLAESFSGTYRNLYAPAFIEDTTALNSLLKTDEIAQAFELWEKLDVAIVGIGNVEFQQISSMFFAEHISPRTLAAMEAQGTVGDICARFFDIQGRQVFPETGVVGIDLNQLKATPDVIGVAGGLEKVRAVLGALRGGFIKTLVTDTETARIVLADKIEER